MRLSNQAIALPLCYCSSIMSSVDLDDPNIFDPEDPNEDMGFDPNDEALLEQDSVVSQDAGSPAPAVIDEASEVTEKMKSLDTKDAGLPKPAEESQDKIQDMDTTTPATGHPEPVNSDKSKPMDTSNAGPPPPAKKERKKIIYDLDDGKKKKRAHHRDRVRRQRVSPGTSLKSRTKQPPQAHPDGNRRMRRAYNKYRGDPTFNTVQINYSDEVVMRHKAIPGPSQPVQDEIFEESDNEINDDLLEFSSDTDYEDEETWRKAKRGKKKSRTAKTWIPKDSVPPPRTVPVLVRNKDVEFVNKSKQLGLASVKSRWELLDRQHRLQEVEKEHPNRYLVGTTIHQLTERIRKGYFNNKEEDFFDFSRQANSDKTARFREKTVQDFLRTVDHTGILVFNTEGHFNQKHLSKEERENLMISFGNLQGIVLFWNDLHNVPSSLIKALEDISLTKVGLGLNQDLKLLEERGIHIGNWVDLGCVRLALYPPAQLDPRPYTPEDEIRDRDRRVTLIEDTKNPNPEFMKFGLSSLVHDLKESGLFDPTYKRTAYDYKKWKAEKFFRKKQFPPQMLPHIIENVRIPQAYLILVADHFARVHNMDLQLEPGLPIIHEALDLCRSRDPEAFQRSLAKDKDYWLAHPEGINRGNLFDIPASATELNNVRRSLADRQELYFSTADLQLNHEKVRERFIGGNALDIPPIFDFTNRIAFTGDERCRNCAKRGHHREKCPEPVRDCLYPHDGETYPEHSTLTCPVLHHFCDICLSVGHLPRVHYDPDYAVCQFQLRRRYFKHMVQGAWTSIPFLALQPDTAKIIKPKHFLFAYEGANFRRCNITRFALKLNKPIRLGNRTESDYDKETKEWLREERIRREEYAKRYNATSLQDIKPLKREFFMAQRPQKSQTKKKKLHLERLRQARLQRLHRR